jgi:phytoene dehydrogenase-like protein
MSENYDVIVVGGGHNGLTAACYLQKAGYKVLVTERLEKAGGGAWTEEATLRDSSITSLSLFHGILHMGPVYKDLELAKYERSISGLTRRLVLCSQTEHALFCTGILTRPAERSALFSKKDAEVYRELAMNFRVIVDNMISPWFFNPPQPNSLAAMAMEGSVEGLNMLRMQLSSPKNVIEEMFESNELKSVLLAFIKEFGGAPDILGFGVFVPMMLGETHDPHGWTICKGGSGKLGEAFVKCLEAHGGRVMTNAEVKRIIIDGDTATGIELADGTVIKADKMVITNLEPHTTFKKLIGEDKLTPQFKHSVERWRAEDTVLFTTHLALDEPLKWKCAEFNPDINRCLGVLLVDNPQELYDDFAEISMQKLPSYPRMFTAYPTAIDPSQAPEGKGTAMGWQYVPYKLRDKTPDDWDNVKEEFSRRCIEVWSQYVTNMDKALLKVHVMSPRDTERKWTSMVHGGFNHGQMTQDQMTVLGLCGARSL